MVITTPMPKPMPSCGSPRRWSGQRRRRNGHRNDASRWSAKYPPAIPKVDEPNVTVLDLKPVDAYVSSVTIDTTPWPQAEQSLTLSSAKLPSEDLQNSPEIEVAESRARKRVHMDQAAPIVHEIIPYAEIYGLHPREFVFNRHYFMVPANGFYEMAATCRTETTDEEDSDTDLEDIMCESEHIEYWI